MKVLVACEFTRTVANAFLARGHEAWSNDILPSETNPEWHIQGDCMDAINSGQWDLIIIHIPCTAMGVCGNATYGKGKLRHHERVEAVRWSMQVWDAACRQSPCVVMENPARVLFPALRKERGAKVQYIQPWQFGHPEQKKTGLALHGVPPLVPTDNVYEQMMRLPKRERESEYTTWGRLRTEAKSGAGSILALRAPWLTNGGVYELPTVPIPTLSHRRGHVPPHQRRQTVPRRSRI